MLCQHYTKGANHSQWPKVLCVISTPLKLSNSLLRILAVPNKAVFCNSPVLIVTPSFSSHASNLLLSLLLLLLLLLFEQTNSAVWLEMRLTLVWWQQSTIDSKDSSEDSSALYLRHGQTRTLLTTLSARVGLSF